MKKIKSLLLMLSTLMLTSCGLTFTKTSSVTTASTTTASTTDSTGETSATTTETSTTTSGETSSSEDTSSAAESSATQTTGYYIDDNSIDDTFNYQAINNSTGVSIVPSTSSTTVNLLCLPIEVSDYPFYGESDDPYEDDDELKDDLDRVMNGNGATDTLYWESLASYYKTSSFGSLNLNITIADVYETGKTASQLYSTTCDGSSVILQSDKYVQDAFDNYKSENPTVDTKIYDNDSNGYIDGIIAIYSAPNATSSRSIAEVDPDGELFWAYCHWVNQGVSGNVNNPIPSAYFWASYDFLYEGPNCKPGGKIDSHTLTHEFGHMMGLDDYYDYDQSKAPAGCCIMMDSNIYDHDAFSKLALGWLDPYVVTDTCTITLKPATTSGECIILPVPNTYNGTAFDEYILMELFTPDGLNELDCTTAYSNQEIGYNQAGVRLWHVDARIGCFENSYSNRKGWYESDAYYATQSTVKSGTSNNKEYYYFVAASNTKAYCTSLVYKKDKTDTGYELLHLIQASKKTNLCSSVSTAKNSDLFTTGNTFNLADYKAQFPNKTKMNSGSELPYSVSFTSVSATSATISITKTN